MAAAVELATAYITVAAEGSSLAPSFARSFRAVEKVAGDSGKRMGRSLTGQVSKATESDVKKAKEAYEQASKKVTATAESQATKVESARRKEEIAQAKVTEALAKYPKESSQVLAAQDRLALASQKVESAQREQQSAMDRANRELDETTRSLRDTERAAESAATPFQRLGDRVKSALKGDFKGAFKPVEREGEDAAFEIEKDFKASGDDSAQGFSSSFKAGIAGFAGGVIATIGIDKLKQAGGAIWEIGASFDDMADTIRVGTGASGAAFEDLQASAKNIASTIPADFSTVGTTVADLNTRLGISGDTLEKVASQYIQAGNILGEEVDVQSTTAAFSAFKLEGDAVSGAMDTLFRVSQATGVGFNELAGSIQSNAPALQNLGFSFEDTASMVGLLDKSGLNADQVMSSLSRSLVNLAKDGEEPASAFNRVTGEIQGFVDAGDIAGATDLASKVFGTRGASQFVGALQSGKLNMEDLQSTVGATGDTILGLGEETADFPEKWQVFKNKALLALEPVGNALFALGGDAMGALADWVEKIDFTPIADGIDSVVDGGKAIWDILVNGDFNGGLFGLSEDSGTVDFLFNLRDAAIWLWEKALKPLGDWIADHGKDIAVFFAGFGGSLLVAGLIALGGAIGGVIASISWIPLAIGAAVGALTWFFTQTEVGKNILSAVVDWMVNTAWPAIKQFGIWIADAAVWLWQNVLAPAWSGIKTVIAATVDWLVNTAWPFIKGVWDAIAGAAMWLWQSVIQPVWNGIKTAIAIAVTAISVYIDLLKWYFSNVIAPVAMWLWDNVMKPVWNGIKTAISAVVTWFRDTAWPILSTVISWISTKFDQFKTGLGIIWDFIKSRVISPVIAWFQNTAWPIISTVLGYIKTGFNVMRDSLKNAWSFIKDTVIAPVANWFRDTIGPLFDRVTGGIKDAFNTMKNAVKKAWEGVRDTAKVPVEFVVNKIINDAIIGNYNDVATTFGLDSIDDVSLPAGWRSGGILPGYTPIHRGDDVLTPMRSGEGVLVSEGLRDSASRRAFLGANEAAKRGISFADFLGSGYAGGGLVKLRMPFAGSYPRGDGFGARGGAHKGIDWPMPSGAILKAVGAGTVSHTWNPAAGRKLELAIGDGLVAGYHHLSSYIAGQGSSVAAGANVARVGNTGRSSGPHLHFSLRRDGKYVDPLPYLGAGGEAGSGEGGWWNPFTSLWSSLKDKVREGVGDNAFGDLLFELPKKIIGGAKDWVTDKITALGDWASDTVDTAGGFARWSPVATQALVREGQYGPRRFSALMRRMNQESGYDPRAINNWDSNAKAGTPSKGLMQVIQPTFDAYRDRSLSSDIYDPLSNIVASIRYTLARYGDLERGWNRPGGYALGGIVNGGIYDTGGVLDSGEFAMNLSGRPEVVLNPSESRAYMAGQASTGAPVGGDTINIYPETDKVPELMTELAWAQRTQRNRRGRYRVGR
ncbi:phage tail tape measure protein [Brachybacterium massiliense]|uniref:phage tail tape measure protein n=1 Tax=Brachybacterium massiliense TaxID=1755098 RepID=UPI00112458FF|nr:phage tail tape measure protein [Brachybacterium massiliense]